MQWHPIYDMFSYLAMESIMTIYIYVCLQVVLYGMRMSGGLMGPSYSMRYYVLVSK